MKSRLSFLFLTTLLASCSMFDGLFEEHDRIWIEVASAERQCIPPDYTSLEDAINQLENNGTAVFDKDALSMPVCAAYSCPTGIIYRAYINQSDLEDTEELGWRYIHDQEN